MYWAPLLLKEDEKGGYALLLTPCLLSEDELGVCYLVYWTQSLLKEVKWGGGGGGGGGEGLSTERG